MFWDSLETREASAAEAAEETLEIARLVARLKSLCENSCCVPEPEQPVAVA